MRRLFLFFLFSYSLFEPDLQGEELEDCLLSCTISSYYDDKVQQMVSYCESDNEQNNINEWDFSFSCAGVAVAKKNEKKWRDYSASVSKNEKADIAFIVKTMAYDSLFSIGKKRPDLKKAGGRIEHVHPFRFLMTVFQDEELKCGIAAIRDQICWVKNGFFDGLIGSLKEENSRNNLMPYVDDFSTSVKVPSKNIESLLKNGAYQEFIDYLIDNIPRQNDPNRYNM